MFKASLSLFLLSQSITGFVLPAPSQIANVNGLRLYNSLRDMASYPDEMKMMENYAEFDRNGAFSGNRGPNPAYYHNNNSMGGKNYYGSDGSYYANRQGRGSQRGGNDYSQRYAGDRRRAAARDREISFRASRGYNGSYSSDGRGYDGIERFGRQRIPSYNGYGSGGQGRNSYSGNFGGDAYSNRSQYDFRRGGDRSGYVYADSMDGYGRGARGGEYSNDPRYRPREDRPVRGFSYSSRVREGNDYGPYYYGNDGMMRDEMMMMHERERRMDGGMGYGGYEDYGQEYGYYNQGGDRRGGYGMGRSEY